jgi:hypothetical protein
MHRARRLRRLLSTAVALGAAASVCPANPAVAAGRHGRPVGAAVLNVPFVPQSEDLCGGAAAAMVMRYWGAQDVYASTFAPLVDRSAAGIRTSALVAQLQRRKWTAIAGAGSGADLAKELGRGRPIITLIEDRPGRYHYVVVIGAADGKIVFHDPARAPSRVADADAFDAAWAKTDRWMLILLPPADLAARSRRSDGTEPPASSGACAAAVESGVRMAISDRVSSRRALEAAARSCPFDSAPWRELAGLDVLDGNWNAAAQHARRAVSNDASDAHAWRELATAQFVLHHDAAALDAWNQVGEPSIDLIDVTGLEATRYDVVAEAIAAAPGETLTSRRLRRAERRLRDVPAIATARVGYHPVDDGRAQIDASVLERARAPVAYPAWIALGVEAAVDREVAPSFANPSGGGDLVALTWRWWAHRPMVGGAYSAPAPRLLGGGVWRVGASRETQTFGSSLVEETRTREAFDLSNWIDDRTRLTGGLALEQWSTRPRAVAASGRIERRLSADRLVLDAGGTSWISSQSFGAVEADAHWRSRIAPDGFVWLGAAGYRSASDGAPPSVWPGADTGHARDVLLRAHPLIDGGVIDGGVFGRRLGFGSVEVQRWHSGATRWPFRFAPAAFIDFARAARGLDWSDTRTHVDAGAGLRVSVPGMGTLRIDVARGLRDGRMAISAGIVR